MKMQRLAGMWLAMMTFAVSVLFGTGCGISKDGTGTATDAVGECRIGTPCNKDGMRCDFDPLDPSKGALVCSSGAYAYGCDNGLRCDPALGGECVQQRLDASAPLRQFACSTSGEWVEESLPPPDASSADATDGDAASVDSTVADTATTDTAVDDTGTADTSVDSAVVDTMVDTMVDDTATADTATTDTASADTATTDTAVADTATADTSTDAADSAVADSTVADSGSTADGSVAETGSDAGTDLVCTTPSPTMSPCTRGYGCLSPDIGGYCVDAVTKKTLVCKCGDGSGYGWLLDLSEPCPLFSCVTDAGAADATSTDTATSDSASDATVSDSSAADSSTSDATVTDSATADSTTADSASDTAAADTAPCVPNLTGVNTGATWSVFTWTPPTGYTQNGPVNLAGQYTNASGAFVADWSVTAGTGLVQLVPDGCGNFVGSVQIQPGSTFLGNIKHADPTMSGGIGWAFDQSSVQTGGCAVLGRASCCNKDFGTITVTKNLLNVTYAHVSNGTASPLAPDSTCDTTSFYAGGGLGKVYTNFTFIAP